MVMATAMCSRTGRGIGGVSRGEAGSDGLLDPSRSNPFCPDDRLCVQTMETFGAPAPQLTANALETGGKSISGHLVFHKSLCWWISVLFREMSQVLVIWERSHCTGK